jgi:hypothetical protein
MEHAELLLLERHVLICRYATREDWPMDGTRFDVSERVARLLRDHVRNGER